MSIDRQAINLGDLRVKAAHRRTHGKDIQDHASDFDPAIDIHPSLFALLTNTAAETEEWRLRGEVLVKKNRDNSTQAICSLRIRRLYKDCDITRLWHDPIFQASLAMAVQARLEILMPEKFTINGKRQAIRIFSGSRGYSQVPKKSPTMHFELNDSIAAGFETLSSHALLSFRAQTAGSGGDQKEPRAAKDARMAKKAGAKKAGAKKEMTDF